MTTFEPSPAPVPPLERAHYQLLELYESARSALESEDLTDQLGSLLADFYHIELTEEDPLPTLRRCIQQVDEQRSELEALPGGAPAVEELASSLSEAERGLAARPFQNREKAPTRASMGQPILLAIDRPAAKPAVGGPPSSPFQETAPPSSLPEGLHPDPLPALSVAGWRRLRAEEHFSDVCACGTYRIPQLGDPWRSAEVMERRMLRALDALVALDGFHFGLLEAMVLSSPTPDPSALFGLTFVGGCLLGRDGLGAAERIYRRLEDEPGFADAFVSGLCLVPHPSVTSMMRLWQADPRPSRRALAIEVLARRHQLSEAELVQAAQDASQVQAKTLVPLAYSGSAQTRGVLDRIGLDVQAQNDDELLRAYRIALVVSGHPQARSEVLYGCRSGDETCGRLSGITAEKVDAQWLLESCSSQPQPAMVDALGWAGDPSCLSLLIGLLGTDDEELVNASAAALERITGAGLMESVEIPPEAAMENDLLAEEEPSELKKQMEDSRDPFPEGSPDTIDLPSRNQEQWQAYVTAHQEQLVPGVCTRRGVAHSPAVIHWELDRGPCTPKERRVLHWELACRGGLLAPFDGEAFVATQELDLERIGQALSTRGASPGSWALPLERQVISAMAR